MAILSKFIFTLASLPVLIPWYLSEKIFQWVFQPLLFMKYRSGRKRARPYLLVLLLVISAIYFARTLYEFTLLQGSLRTAMSNGSGMLYMVYNDVISVLNYLLRPVNTLIIFGQGGDVTFNQAILAFYLVLVPIVFVCALLYCTISTSIALRCAAGMAPASQSRRSGRNAAPANDQDDSLLSPARPDDAWAAREAHYRNQT